MFQIINFSLPSEISSLPTNTIFDHFFNLCSDPPIFASPPSPNFCPAVYVRMVSGISEDLGQLKCTASNGGKWTFQLKSLSLFCHCERNRWQIFTTKSDSHWLAKASDDPGRAASNESVTLTGWHFQVTHRPTWNSLHGRAARQSRVRFRLRIPEWLTQQPGRSTKLKLCRCHWSTRGVVYTPTSVQLQWLNVGAYLPAW